MFGFLLEIKSEVFIWAILFGGHCRQTIAMPETPLFMVKGDERPWGLNAVG